MKFDIYGNKIYQELDLVNLIYKNKTNALESILIDDTESIKKFKELSDLNLKIYDDSILTCTIEEFDSICQTEWRIPVEYQQFDIKHYCLSNSPITKHSRILEELLEFDKRNLMQLLKTLKYIVDTLRLNKVLWGVGRGSSVSSYVLFLLGVHRIDPIKYGLDWREFLR